YRSATPQDCSGRLEGEVEDEATCPVTDPRGGARARADVGGRRAGEWLEDRGRGPRLHGRAALGAGGGELDQREREPAIVAVLDVDADQRLERAGPEARLDDAPAGPDLAGADRAGEREPDRLQRRHVPPGRLDADHGPRRGDREDPLAVRPAGGVER